MLIFNYYLWDKNENVFFMDEELKGDTNMKLRIFERYTQYLFSPNFYAVFFFELILTSYGFQVKLDCIRTNGWERPCQIAAVVTYWPFIEGAIALFEIEYYIKKYCNCNSFSISNGNCLKLCMLPYYHKEIFILFWQFVRIIFGVVLLPFLNMWEKKPKWW